MLGRQVAGRTHLRAVIMPPELVAVDLDGTLIGKTETVSQKAAAALRGVTVAIVSGRPLASVAHVAASVGARFAIPLNGAAVIDLQGSHTLWVHNGFERSTLTGLVEEAAKRGVRATCHALAAWYVSEIDAIVRTLAERHRVTPIVAEWTDIPSPILKVQITGTPATLAELRAAMPTTVVVSAARDHIASYLEISPPGVDKAGGIGRLIKHLDVGWASVMVLGDGENDIPACRKAGIAVAIGDANPGLVAVATHVVRSTPEEDAVAIAVAGLVHGDRTALARVRRTGSPGRAPRRREAGGQG